ncbi:efflux RND transporter periplasmic adaptor subunit [Thalassotalea ganghwensis]
MDKKITPKAGANHVKLGALIGTLFLFACAVFSDAQLGPNGRIQKVSVESLVIHSVTQGVFVDALSLRGQVVPKSTIYLDTTTGGQVEERLVEQGDFVKKGQPLVRLSNPNLQLEVMSREAQVTEQLNFLRNTQMNMETNRLNLRRDLLEIELQIAHLERRLKQSLPLVNQGVLAKDSLAEISENLDYFRARKRLTIERQQQENSIRKVQVEQLADSAQMLEKNLQFARKNLENLLIKAPVSGYLSDLDVEMGESKSRGTRLGQIDIPNEYKLVVRLDEFYLNQVRIGMAVNVKLSSDTVKASVSKIDSRVNQSLFLIEVALPNTVSGIKRGQNLDVDLMLSEDNRNALLLKRGAFFTNTGGNWVYVVEAGGDSATRRDIQLGKKNQDYFEVLTGLEQGEQVITSSYGNFDQAPHLKLQ